MTLRPISTDTTATTQTGSDSEKPSKMLSPTLSNFSFISISQGRRSDEPNNVLPNNASGNDAEGEKTLLPPDSFVALIKKLPGLILEENVYQLDAPLLAGDLKEFTSHTKHVEELILTDAQLKKHPQVSPDVIARLAMIQDVNIPFFPSLKRLRLVDVDLALAFLWFCITPSLETVEVGGVPQTRQITISSFFKELVLKVPLLAKITLGPGRLPASTIQSSVQFNQLVQLRIIDAASVFDFEFLRAVSALPKLEVFDINARTAEYTPYTRSYTLPVHPFPRLTKLTVISNVLLMGDLVYRLVLRGIEEVSLTLVRDGLLLIPSHWMLPVSKLSPSFIGPAKTFSEMAAFASSPLSIGPLSQPVGEAKQDDNPSGSGIIPCHTFEVKKKGFTQTVPRICRGDGCEDIRHVCSQCQEIKKEHFRAEALRIKQAELASIVCSQITHFSSIIGAILERGKPRTIFIDRLDIASFVMHLNMTLLPDTFYRLISCPSLETLRIENWALIFVSETFEIPNSPYMVLRSSMQTLHLPIETTLNSGITLATLRVIAHRYPSLRTLQTRITTSLGFNSDTLKKDLIPHNLKELSVGGGSLSMEDKFAIAPYICSLFPYLQFTKSEGQDAKDWQFVFELVTMCQKVLRDTGGALRPMGA